MKFTRYGCHECKEIFETFDEFSKHQAHSLNDLVEFCEICLLRIPKCVTKSLHFKTHPRCPSCDMRFATYEKFVLHAISKHIDAIPKNLILLSKYGGSVCSICGWTFGDSGLCEIHIRCIHPIAATIFQKHKRDNK